MSGDTADARSADPPVEEVLLVGTFAGGGIHQYVDQQYEELRPRFDVERHDMYSPSSGGGLRWFVLVVAHTLLAALRFVRRSPPELLHVHTSHRYSFYRASFYLLFARYVWDRPVVLHVHGSSFDKFVRDAGPAVQLLQRTVFEASEEVVVLSEYWRDVLADRVPLGKISVVPNAVDPNLYDPQYGSTPPRVVFVSNLKERKGVSELAAAIRQLDRRHDGEFAVDIAGDGPLRAQVEQLEAEISAVEYHGYVSEEDKRDLLNRGTVFVLPTYAEGLPIAVLEAMAGGNAVVSTTVGSIPEVIDDDRGVLVPPGDADALANALSSLVADPERAAAMGRTNRAAVDAEYSWDHVVDRITDIYRETARSTP